jgi:hypothetical protein
VRNEEELKTVQDRNIIYTLKLLKANFICHILRGNCLLKHVIEGKIEGRIEVRGRRERRCKQLVDHLKKRRGYCKLKEKALYRSLLRSSFGIGCGPVLRQTAMNAHV